MFENSLHFLGRKDIVEVLLKHGSNLNITDGDGQTALDKAILSGNY